MKIILFLSVFLVGGIVSSCYRGYTFKTTDYCYFDKTTDLSSKLNLNGYYSEQEVITYNEGFPSKQVTDTITRNFIFYPDGILLYGFKEDLYNKKNGIYKGGDHSQFWGRYYEKNDTIKAHCIVGTISGAPRIVYIWFNIIDSTVIKEICFKWHQPITEKNVFDYLENPPEYKISQTNAEFIHYDGLPDPNLSWIKKKKWFWCDKEQFKAWKKERRKKKL